MKMDEATRKAIEREAAERGEAMKNRPTYPLPVRLGHWNDELALIEEKKRLASYKRDRCQLLIQKTRNMFKNVLREVPLAVEAPFVKYGETYQFKASELPSTIVPQEGLKAAYGLYLSALINEHDIEHGQHFMHGCNITASPDKTPCVRNTFVFESCDQSNKTGQTVYYGDDVFIRIYESNIPLYVQCECDTYDNFGGHLGLRLSQSPDIYCKFKIYHWNPASRYETTSTAFPPNNRVIIQHTASGRNLAAEYHKWIPTFFGAEVVVSCHTFRDSHRMETAENMWKVMGVINPDISLYVRAAKGEQIPDDLLN